MWSLWRCVNDGSEVGRKLLPHRSATQQYARRVTAMGCFGYLDLVAMFPDKPRVHIHSLGYLGNAKDQHPDPS